MAAYHGTALLFQACDYYGWAQQYRWRAQPRQLRPRVSYRQALPRVLWNQLAVLLPAMMVCELAGWAFAPFPRPGDRDYYVTALASADKNPGGAVLAFTVMGTWMLLAHECVFYLFHRFVLHHPVGYRVLGHALHHRTDATCAVTAMFMTPADFFLEIVLPYLLPLCCCSTWVRGVAMNTGVLVLGMLGGLYEHSGYNFLPGVYMLDTYPHATHHRAPGAGAGTGGNAKHFADGVGSFGLVDAMLGTAEPDLVSIVRAIVTKAGGGGGGGGDDEH
jgi:sterol desaturase/sphingolipid hydroxylase (fatty acid hydroxylase superfamily)